MEKSPDERPFLGVFKLRLAISWQLLRLLGVTMRSDLKWTSNTKDIVKRAYNKLWILRRLKQLGANSEELVDIYNKQCRSILEYAVPAWNGAITKDEIIEIERVQKVALHIILGEQYGSYKDDREKTKLETLEVRRENLSLKFAKKAEKHPKHKNWFIPRPVRTTRHQNSKYWSAIARTERLKKSPIPYLTDLLNKHYTND